MQFLLDAFGAIAEALKVASKAAAWAEKIGKVLTALSAVITGSIWKGLAAGLIDLGLSLAAGAAVTAILPFFGTTILGIIGLVVAVAIITAVIIVIENFILDLLKNASRILLQPYAVARARGRGWETPAWSRLTSVVAWGAAV